jgi:dTDP-4-dehydrorhamnose reductase
MRIAVLGADGRLGAVIASEFEAAGHNVVRLTLADLDVRDALQVEATCAHLRPQAIVNCTAYNAVDAAEADPASAFAVNAEGPRFLARAAEVSGAVLVHYSTDFVFDGRARSPYTEDDRPNPLSVYGASKLAGEVEARRAPRHYVLRLSSLFGGRAFGGHRATIDRMAEEIRMSIPVRAFVNRTVSPSYVPDVARATRQILERALPFGTYHCVSSGYTAWFQLANEIARVLERPARLIPVEASSIGSGASRPMFCALSNARLQGFGIELPSWQATIRTHVSLLSSVAPSVGAALRS